MEARYLTRWFRMDGQREREKERGFFELVSRDSRRWIKRMEIKNYESAVARG